MKKQKLSLDALKVKSFVTSLDTEKENTVKGGGFGSITSGCPVTNECVATTPQGCGTIGGGTGGGTGDGEPKPKYEEWTGVYVCGGVSSDGTC